MEKRIASENDSTYGDRSDAVGVARVRSFGLFFTVVLTAAVVAGCGLAATVVVIQGRSSAEVEPQECPTVNCEPSYTADKMMDMDMARETMMMTESGMMTEELKYDHETNTVLIEAPGNFSGFSAATVVLDYDRSHIFVNVHDENACFSFSWPTEIAENIKEYMTNGNNDEVVDLTSRSLESLSYDVNGGQIPAGYVKTSNGAIVSALCSGRDSYWVEEGVSTRVRRAWGIHICVCWGWFCVSAEF